MAEIGKQYQHKNGNIYTVILLTNTATVREDHPIDVVYIGQNGNVWSRKLSEWGRSFTEYKPPLNYTDDNEEHY